MDTGDGGAVARLKSFDGDARLLRAMVMLSIGYGLVGFGVVVGPDLVGLVSYRSGWMADSGL